MTDKPLTEKDFEHHPYGREFNLTPAVSREKVQSAKRLLKKEITERVHFGFPSDRNMALYLVDACFQIDDNQEAAKPDRDKDNSPQVRMRQSGRKSLNKPKAPR